MPTERDITALTREPLLALVVVQQQSIEALQARLKELEEELRCRKRGNRGSAAPFSKGERQDNPQKPGRKPGQGEFTHREAPAPENVTESVIEVPLKRRQCPGCGAELSEPTTQMAYVTDLPEEIRPVVSAYEVTVCHCKACGKSVRGEHPDLAEDPYGASAHLWRQRSSMAPALIG